MQDHRGRLEIPDILEHLGDLDRPALLVSLALLVLPVLMDRLVYQVEVYKDHQDRLDRLVMWVHQVILVTQV